jgi:hypothetical protein
VFDLAVWPQFGWNVHKKPHFNIYFTSMYMNFFCTIHLNINHITSFCSHGVISDRKIQMIFFSHKTLK